jgi:hypothetical protein
MRWQLEHSTIHFLTSSMAALYLPEPNKTFTLSNFVLGSSWWKSNADEWSNPHFTQYNVALYAFHSFFIDERFSLVRAFVFSELRL